MNFGISDNSCMFVTFNANEQTKHISRNGYFLWLCVSYYLHDIRLSLPVRLLQKCNGCSLARMGGDGLSSFNNFKIHLTMPTNNELEVKAQGASTSQVKTQSQLQREKGKKFLGILKNILMFVPFNTTRTNKQAVRVIFIPVHFLSIYKTVGLSVALLQLCKSVLVVKNERLDSLSVFNNFKFIDK